MTDGAARGGPAAASPRAALRVMLREIDANARISPKLTLPSPRECEDRAEPRRAPPTTPFRLQPPPQWQPAAEPPVQHPVRPSERREPRPVPGVRQLAARCRARVTLAALKCWAQHVESRRQHVRLLAQALSWRLQTALWGWAMYTAGERKRRNRRAEGEMVTVRLLSLLGRRRRRIFELWAAQTQIASERDRARLAAWALDQRPQRTRRSFRAWRDWFRLIVVSTDLLRYRLHRCLACWHRVAAQQHVAARTVLEVQAWRAGRVLEEALGKWERFAARQLQLRELGLQAAELCEENRLLRSYGIWRRLFLAAEGCALAVEHRVHRGLRAALRGWRAAASRRKALRCRLCTAQQRAAARCLSNIVREWSRLWRQELERQRWTSTARRALRTWQLRASRDADVAAASRELSRRMDAWSLAQAWAVLRLGQRRRVRQRNRHSKARHYLRRWQNELLRCDAALAAAIEFAERRAGLRVFRLWRGWWQSMAAAASAASRQHGRRLASRGLRCWLREYDLRVKVLALQLGVLARILGGWYAATRRRAVGHQCQGRWRWQRLCSAFMRWHEVVVLAANERGMIAAGRSLRLRQVLTMWRTEAWHACSVRQLRERRAESLRRRALAAWMTCIYCVRPVEERQARRFLAGGWRALRTELTMGRARQQRHARLLASTVRTWSRKAQLLHRRRERWLRSVAFARHWLQLVSWRRWTIFHSLELRVKMYGQVLRLRMLAEAFSSLQEHLLYNRERLYMASSQRQASLSKQAFFSWRRWFAEEEEGRALWGLVSKLGDRRLGQRVLARWRRNVVIRQRNHRTMRGAAAIVNLWYTRQLCAVGFERWARHTRRMTVTHRREQRMLARGISRGRLLRRACHAWKQWRQELTDKRSRQKRKAELISSSAEVENEADACPQEDAPEASPAPGEVSGDESFFSVAASESEVRRLAEDGLPKYHTKEATALHLRYTASGRRLWASCTARRRWTKRLSRKAWESWRGAMRVAHARRRRAERFHARRLLLPVFRALGEGCCM